MTHWNTMDDRQKKFDSEKLFRRKQQHGGYRICPFCGGELVEKQTDGLPRMVCARDDCDFVFYQNPIPAAGAIIVEDDRVLLVKRAHPPRVGWWCLPAGFMEWNEHPTETAVRELKEETGLDVKLKSLFDIYSGNDDPRVNALLILYLADIVGGSMQASDDALEVRYFKFDSLPDNIAFEAHVQALADYSSRYRNS
jgi:ADP-ribose pyrophosphatase YjhB (NUDIX family)